MNENVVTVHCKDTLGAAAKASVQREPAVVESMTKLGFAGFTFRVWRTQDGLQDSYDNSDLDEVVKAAGKAAGWEASGMKRPDLPRPEDMLPIIRALGSTPGVSAVECVDDVGEGVVIYMEWP